MVPPDPMPNSEVKRRSADGSVGSPHVRVGNCRASNKTKGSVGRLGLLFLCFAARGAAIFPGGAALTGATDPVARKRCEAPPPGKSRCHSNVNERPGRKTGPFVFVFCGQTRRHLPRWRCAYRGYRPVARKRCAAPPPGKGSCLPAPFIHAHDEMNPAPNRYYSGKPSLARYGKLMLILHQEATMNLSLKPRNTFGISHSAKSNCTC